MSEVKIIHEDKDFLIVLKPAGMVVHPDKKNPRNTLVDLILEKYPEIKKIGEYPDRPGIVHRLDKNVSGLLVIARNQKMFDHLKNEFKQRKIKKEYLALVYGELEKDEGIIEFPLVRGEHGKIVARPKSDRSLPESERAKQRLALTQFEVLKRFKPYTLLKVRPKTGRTHQIRSHLKALGHPIVGDELYQIKIKKKAFKKRVERDSQTLGRIFLHALSLGFCDLKGKWQEFKSELPNELKGFLEKI